MMIHEITALVGRNRRAKRVGRGRASGKGKTSGRGHKGAGSRAGFSSRPGFEGGQMPLVRRLPKRGFTNATFRRTWHIVNLRTLEARLEAGAEVTLERLAEMGIVRDTANPLKVLGDGDLTKALHVTAGKVSAAARTKIEVAGGSVTETPPRRWTQPARKKGEASG